MKHDLESFGCIKEELEKYECSLIEKFIELLPSPENKYCIYTKTASKIVLKSRAVGMTTMIITAKTGVYQHINIWIKDTDDFWYRWNRFKKLRAFL